MRGFDTRCLGERSSASAPKIMTKYLAGTGKMISRIGRSGYWSANATSKP